MFYSTKERAQKGCSNYSSIPSSPSMTEATSKKKMFARKPANAIGNLVPQKKKPTFEQSLDSLTMVRPAAQSFKHSAKPTEAKDWRLTDRILQVSRNGPVKTESSINKYRQIFFSPKSEKTLLGTGGALQRKPSKNHTDFKPRDISLRSTIGFGKSAEFDVSMDSDDFSKNWKFKTNSSKSIIPASKLSDSRRSSEKSIKEGSLMIECSYCENHKKKAGILAQKYAKLQEQYKVKEKAIKQLNNKYDALLKQKDELLQRLQRTIQTLQIKQQQYFRGKEEMALRIDSYKKETMRLAENIKYNQIQKSMLLRFKNDFHMLSKEYEQLKYQNDQYKKQLIAVANRQHRYTFNKRYQGSPQHPGQFSKKTLQQPNIHYDCEDESVSLNFSQHSYDYP